MSANETIKELGLKIPKVNRHGKGFINIRRHENLLYLSGQGPLDDNGSPLWQGKVGSDLSLEEAYQAARYTGTVIIGILQDYLGDLNRVDAFIKVLGLIASADNFYEQPKVMHGFSDLIVEVFGERGLHARSALGTSVLPFNIPIEIEVIVRIRD